MGSRNLAVVFGPTLIQPRDSSMLNMVKDMSAQCQIIEAIILNVRLYLFTYFVAGQSSMQTVLAMMFVQYGDRNCCDPLLAAAALYLVNSCS
jgi:hypothetical protein